MIRCKSEKAKEIEEKLSEKIGYIIQIRKGVPGERMKEGYYAYMSFKESEGYGHIFKYSETLNGLLGN